MPDDELDPREVVDPREGRRAVPVSSVDGRFEADEVLCEPGAEDHWDCRVWGAPWPR